MKIYFYQGNRKRNSNFQLLSYWFSGLLENVERPKQNGCFSFSGLVILACNRTRSRTKYRTDQKWALLSMWRRMDEWDEADFYC